MQIESLTCCSNDLFICQLTLIDLLLTRSGFNLAWFSYLSCECLSILSAHGAIDKLKCFCYILVDLPLIWLTCASVLSLLVGSSDL